MGWMSKEKTPWQSRIRNLPVLVLMPHSSCNCRCVMCDIWRANKQKREISRDDLVRHLASFRHLGVRWVVLSGGEALLHSNLWQLCHLLRELPARITLLSTGILLRRFSSEVLKGCDDVIVSLDGSREIHNQVRNVPRAFDDLVNGVASLKDRDPTFKVTGRCVIQRRNFFDLDNIVAAAREMGLDQISFLAADITSTAFNRPDGWPSDRRDDVSLSQAQVPEFAEILGQFIRKHTKDFASGFIAESPKKLWHIHSQFAASRGAAEWPRNQCNAPWVSAVIEADGAVRPCFFHPEFGNIHDEDFNTIVNSKQAIEFRQRLAIETDPICRKCVCTLYWSKKKSGVSSGFNA